jgi:integrase
MSVYRPKDRAGAFKSPYYQFDFVIKVNGERRRVHGSTGETTKARAKEYERKEKDRAKAARPNDDMTLATAATKYCDEIASKPSAGDTEKALEHCCRLIGGAKMLVNISAEDITEAIRRRSGETKGKTAKKLIAPATVNRQIVEPLRRVMKRAKRAWGVGVDPEAIDWAELRLKEPKGRVREFTADEAEAFWRALRADYVPLVYFLAIRGLRVRAALGMEKKRHVDLQHRRILVWQKGEGFVWRPLTAEQVAIVSAAMAKSPLPCVWTYERQRGTKAGTRSRITYDGLRRTIGTTLKAAGIVDFRIHDLRHDFASKLLRSTRNLKLVKEALGHADISSTARYAHVLDQDVVEGMEQMSRNYPGMPGATPLKTGAK